MQKINELLSDSVTKDICIISQNVREYANACVMDSQCIDTMLYEMAGLINKAIGDDLEALCEIMRALRADAFIGSDAEIEIYTKLLAYYLELFGNSLILRTDVFLASEIPSSSLSRIAYVKNNFTEKAFWAFSSSLSSPKALYATSFENACEEVYNGAAQYCILPIENSTDGKLIGFYSLIDKYDLKIFSVCNIEYNDSSSSTKFALLKRSLEPPVESAFTDEKTFLEISYTHSDSVSILDVLNAAGVFGLHLIKIDSAMLEYGEDQYKFYSVFSASRNQILDFLVFLHIYTPEFLPIGVYKYV